MRMLSRIVITSFAVPIAFILIMFLNNLLERNFRGSHKYRFIYSYGSTICTFTQLGLTLISLLLALNVAVNYKKYTVWTNIIAFLFGASVFLYLFIGVTWGIIRSF